MAFNLGPYMKAVNSTIGAAVGTALLVISDGEFDWKDGLSVLITALVTFNGVFWTRNTAKQRYGKLFVGAIATLAGLLLSAWQDGTLVNNVWVVTAVLTVLNGIMISQTANSVVSDGLEPPFVD
jgi:hypothetical protein